MSIAAGRKKLLCQTVRIPCATQVWWDWVMTRHGRTSFRYWVIHRDVEQPGLSEPPKVFGKQTTAKDAYKVYEQATDFYEGWPGAIPGAGYNKYHNVPTEVDGYRFDSIAEAARYQQLKLMEKAGEIENLLADKKGLRLPVFINGFKVFDYEADFLYVEKRTGLSVYEDVKGHRTPEYRLKKKCVEAYYGITIREVQV
jgi:hypothetical protein